MTSYRESPSHISFTAPEFHRDGRFRPARYEYHGSASRGWRIVRDGRPCLQLGPGFAPLQTRCCGICATDMARAALPFPLPQVTGHEVLCRRDGQTLAVDINASHRTRDCRAAACPWCSAGLETHCPQRLTLGIDRLPGGFAPWILAPVAALHPLPASLPLDAALFAEPFAAALRAVAITPPRPGDRVAVLGPRRLGLLVLAALASHRRRHDLDFTITALHRHHWLTEYCRLMGADASIHVEEAPIKAQEGVYDIVFDTTGNPAGLQLALRLARRTVHLKSTHGREAGGMARLTEMVIDEISLHPFSLAARPPSPLPDSMVDHCHVYVSPTVPEALQRRLRDQLPRCRTYRMDRSDALSFIARHHGAGKLPLPGFDMALVGSLAEADRVIRPRADASCSLLHARGALLVANGAAAGDGALAQAMGRGIEIQTSRCGRIPLALDTLATQPALAGAMAERLVTHRFPVRKLAQAFAAAGRGERAVKVVVDTWEDTA